MDSSSNIWKMVVRGENIICVEGTVFAKAHICNGKFVSNPIPFLILMISVPQPIAIFLP